MCFSEVGCSISEVRVLIQKRYSKVERDFAFEWVDRWFQLVSLIIDLVRSDETSPSLPPPTDIDEINYQRLRFWFIDHEEQFKPLWRDFYELDIQSGIDLWDPSRHRAQTASVELLKIDKRVVEFFEWIDDRAMDP